VRTQATIVPTFWTRGSGKKLRGNADAQVLAFYFMTSPHSTMVGIFYSSVATILDETGLTEPRFRAALPAVAEIAQYDEQEGIVFLPEGSAHQIGETMSIGNKVRKPALSQLQVYGNHRFVREWIYRYYDAYCLSHEGIPRPDAPYDAPSKTRLRPVLHPPSMGHSTTLHPPDPRSDPDPDPKPDPRSRVEPPPDEPPLVATLQTRAAMWVKDPNRGSMVYPQPESWSEMLDLQRVLGETFGFEVDPMRTSADRGCRNVLLRWSEGNDQARMRAAIRGSAQAQNIRDKPEHQTLATIFTDADCVSKYARLSKQRGDNKPTDKPRPRPAKVDPDEEILNRRKSEHLQQVREKATPEEIATAESTARAVTALAAGLFKP